MAAGSRGPPNQFTSLPDSALAAIWCHLPAHTRRCVLPLVCRRFRELAATCSSLWEQVHLSFPEGFERSLDQAQLFGWVVGREGAVRSLHVDLSTPAAWPPILAVLGVLGRQLERLRLAGETPACQRPGCAAPWLALVPNLTCLELDDAVDGGIAAAHFPPGLTRLELSYCGEEGLPAVPPSVVRCTALRSLVLNGAALDSDASLAGLAAFTTLEHLDLSNCCLTRVPAALARLPHLTSLTLNENDALGGSAAALAPLAALTALEVLEMRECGLTGVPASVAGLTRLRSLLMGYNAMTERPFLPPGPYLAGLRVLAMSDARGFQDDRPWEELAGPLEGARALQVLRINRCLGLQPSIEDVAMLLRGKPAFRKLELTADMLADPRDLAALRQRWPAITFKTVE